MAKFGIAYPIAFLFTDSKLTPVVIICILVLGFWAIDSTPKEDNPQIVVPGATIIIDFPGASAEEVEQLVIKPIENSIKLISGIADYYSTASHSRAELSIFFEVTEDQEEALVRVHDRFEKISKNLPVNSAKPIINSINIADVPIITITLSSVDAGERKIKMFAEELLDDLILIDDVSSVYIKGGLDSDVIVELDPSKIIASKIQLRDIISSVSDAGMAVPLGLGSVADTNNFYVFEDGINSVAELESVAVRKSPLEGEILLRDVASVGGSVEKWRKTISLFGFGRGDTRNKRFESTIIPAVTIAISKKKSANSVTVSDQVNERLAIFVEKHKSQNIYADVTRDDGSVARHTFRELFYHLAIAITVVFIITYIFLGFKAACVVGFTVPLVLALTIFIISSMGLTLNRVSLLALIIALGMLVDDAIVVLENIYRSGAQCASEISKKDLVVNAASEVGNPTNIATLAIVIVFLSMLVVTGMPGEFFYPVSVTVPIAMLASLFVAYSVVPWLAFNFLDFSKHTAPIDKYSGKINSAYQHALVILISNKRIRYSSLFLVLFLLFLVLLMPAWQFVRPSGVGGEPPAFGVLLHSMPRIDTNTFNIVIEIPKNKTLMYSHHVAQSVADKLFNNEYVTNFQIWLGESGVEDFNGILRGTSSRQGPNVAEIRVNLVDKGRRSYSSIDIARDVRSMLSDVEGKFDGVLIRVVEDPPGPPVRAGLLAELYGNDSAELRKIALGLMEVFKSTWDVLEVSDSVFDDVYQYKYKVNEDALKRLAVNRKELYSVLDVAINGIDLGRIKGGAVRDERHILLKYPSSDIDSLVSLENLKVTGLGGGEVPLSELLVLEKTKLGHPIFHKNGSPVVYVTGEMNNSVPLYGVLDISSRLKKEGIDKSYRVNGDGIVSSVNDGAQSVGVMHWDGAYDQVLQAFEEMFFALFISLVLIYVLLVYYYKSFAIPLIAMAVIPFSLIGIFPAHWIFSELFTSTSMIGVIAIAGVVVRNSLLIFDFVFESLRNGRELKSAVIECTVSRLRPIVLTAASIFLGSAVLIKDPLFSGLGLSLVFGTVVATIMSLFVTPVFLYFYLKKQSGGRVFNE
ncbi:efflux RND transporter permease subunit [Zhongshania guokunii]|uniref:Efflux RND transporter permease subunit n=1 Tax=Zhongshania guokunii TaxID=641783 RepID=A0ABV3UAF0_9GAMM